MATLRRVVKTPNRFNIKQAEFAKLKLKPNDIVIVTVKRSKRKPKQKRELLPPKERMARDRKILQMKLDGRTNESIADELHMSEGTVGVILARMNKIYNRNPESLGLYLCSQTMRLLCLDLGTEDPTLKQLEQYLENPNWR